MLSSDPTSYAFNHTGLDVDPRYTADQGFRDFALSRYGQREGMSVPTGEGFIEEAKQSFVTGVGRAATGIAKTAAVLSGDEDAARSIDEDRQAAIREKPWLAPVDYGTLWDNLSTDPGSWAGQVVGGAAASTLPYIGFGVAGGAAGRGVGASLGRLGARFATVGARTGAAAVEGATIAQAATTGMKAGQMAAQFTGSMGTYFGENYLDLIDTARNNGVELSSKQAFATAAIRTSLGAVIEMGVGGQEANLVRNLLGKNALSKLGRDAASREIIENAAFAGFFGKWSGAGSWVTRTAKQAGGEGFEEVLDSVLDMSVKRLAAGDTVGFVEAASDLVEAGVTGFVGGLGFGGISEAMRMRGEAKIEAMADALTQAEEQKIGLLLGAEGLKKSNEAFAAFAETLPADFRDIAPVIRNVSFKMALETGKKPEDYINQLKTLFLDETRLPEARRKAFVQELLSGKSASATLQKYFGDSYQNLVRSAVTQARVRDWRKINDTHSAELAKRGIRPIDDTTEAGKTKAGTVSRWVGSLIGDAKELSAEGKSFRIGRARTMAFVDANHDLAREWYATGGISGLKIGGASYDAILTEQGAVFIPTGDAKVAKAEGAAQAAEGGVDKGSLLELATEMQRHKRIAHAMSAMDSGWDDFKTILGTVTQPEVLARVDDVALKMSVPDVALDEDDLAFYDAHKAEVDAKAAEYKASLAETVTKEERAKAGWFESLKAEAKKRLEAFRSVQNLPEPEGGRENMTEQGTLFQAKDEPALATIYGIYDPRAKLAAFFSKADAGTVIHEWVHHVTTEGLLPDNVANVFKKTYGNAEEDGSLLSYAQLKQKYPQATESELVSKLRWNMRAEENLAQSFILWIRDGRLPQGASEELLAAYGSLQKQFKVSWSRIVANYAAQDVQRAGMLQATGRTEEDVVFNPETRAAIEKLFDGVTEGEVERLYGTVAADTIESSRAAHGADPATAMAQFEGAVETLLQSEDGTPDARKTMRWFWSEAGKMAKKANITNAQAKKLVLDAYGYSHLHEVPPEVMVKMARDLRAWQGRSTLARSKASLGDEEARKLQEALVAGNDTAPRSLKYAALMEGSNGLVNASKNMVKWARSKYTEYVADRYLMIDKIEADPNGPLHQLGARLYQGDNVKAAKKRAYEKMLIDYENTHGKFPNDLDAKVSLDGLMVPKGHVLALYIHANGGKTGWQQLYSVKEIMRSNGLTEKQIVAAVDFVKKDPESLRLVEASQQLFAQVWDDVAPVYKEVTGRDLGKIGGMYLTMARENGMVGKDDWMSMLDRVQGPNNFRNRQDVENVRATWQQSRGVEGERILGPVSLDFQKQIARYYSQAANYIGSAQAVKDAMAVLTEPKVQASFIRRFGEKSEIYSALLDIIQRDLSYNGRTEAYSAGERWLGLVKNNAYSALLAYNPYSVMNQLLSLPASFSMLPIGESMTAIQTFAQLADKAFRKGGTRDGSLFAKDPRYLLMASKSPHILSRMANQQIEDWQEQHGSSIGRTGIKVLKAPVGSIIEGGLVAMANTDMAVTVAIWHAAYSGQMKIANRRGVSPELADKAAVEYADSVVRQSQNPSLYSQKGRLQTKNELYKMFTPFSGQAFAAFKFNYENFVEPLMKGVDEGGIAGGVKALGKSLTDITQWKKMAFYNVIPALIFTTIALRKVPDEDELLKGILVYPLLSVPVLGPIMWTAAITGFADGNSTFIGNAFKGVGIAVKDVATGEVFENPDKSLGRMANTVSTLIGIPQYPRKLAFAVFDEMAGTSTVGDFAERDTIYRNTIGPAAAYIRDAIRE